MLRLAICDDDTRTIEQIETYIEDIKDIHLTYEVYFSAEELYNHIYEEEFDAYILDIKMMNMSGIQLARKIREYNQYSLIIFMTNYSQYVLDVFDIITFDFILKPLKYERFIKVIHRASDYLFISKTSFVFNHNKKQYAIPYQNIVYIEKEKRKAYIYVHLGKRHECNTTMEDILQQLTPKLFVKINRGCIVNLSMISEIVKDEIVLVTGQVLYMARDYKMAVKERHLDFFRNWA